MRIERFAGFTNRSCSPDLSAIPGERRGATSLSVVQTGERQRWGLTEAEAAARCAQGQGNDVKLKTSRTYTEILQENVFTFFNIVLFSLAILLFLLGSPKDAFFTGVVAMFNVLVATIQEVRAKRKLDRIALLAQPTATVIREGQQKVCLAIFWSQKPAIRLSSMA